MQQRDGRRFVMAKARVFQKPNAKTTDLGQVGANAIASSIKTLRRRREITLEKLAALTAMDKGYLSRIERGQKSPSVGTLLKIAEALNVQVSQLFGEATSDDSITVIRRSEYVAISSEESSDAFLQVLLPSNRQRRMSAFLIEPGIERDTRQADHPGDEMVYVLQGSIEIIFPDRVIQLLAGDCIHFDGHLRHQLGRINRKPARALIIVAQDLQSRSVDVQGRSVGQSNQTRSVSQVNRMPRQRATHL
jgi:transcriptional regulator with XRE-family HTH domain